MLYTITKDEQHTQEQWCLNNTKGTKIFHNTLAEITLTLHVTILCKWYANYSKCLFIMEWSLDQVREIPSKKFQVTSCLAVQVIKSKLFSYSFTYAMSSGEFQKLLAKAKVSTVWMDVYGPNVSGYLTDMRIYQVIIIWEQSRCCKGTGVEGG